MELFGNQRRLLENNTQKKRQTFKLFDVIFKKF